MCVTNILVAEHQPDPAIPLTLGVRDTGQYGQNFNGQTDADGLVQASFSGTCQDLLLTFDGFDIDTNTAPSSGGFLLNLGIKTTDLMGAAGYNEGDYTRTDAFTGFGGTSSAAPVVSGVTALMLDANPNFGWRDVQKILA